nr:hypothetical protein [Enterobacter asburiae]
MAKASGENLTAILTVSDGKKTSTAYAITAGDASEETSSISVDKKTYVAGTDMKVTVTLKDGNGNLVVGQGVKLTSDTVKVANAFAKPKNWIDNNDGTYTATYIASTAGAGLNASMKLNSWGRVINSGVYQITFDPSTMKVKDLHIVSGRDVIADGFSSYYLKGQVLDDYNNKPFFDDINQVPSIIVSSMPSNSGLIVSQPVIDNYGSVTFSVASKNVFSTDVYAAISGMSGSVSNSVNLGFIADLNTAYIKDVSAEAKTNISNNIDSNKVSVIVVDGQGHPVPDVGLNLEITDERGNEISDSSISITSESLVTDANGYGFVTIRSKIPQSVTVKFSIHVGQVNSGSDNVRFVDALSLLNLEPISVSSSGSSVLANGTDYYKLSTRVLGNDGRPVSNQDVTLLVDNMIDFTWINKNSSGPGDKLNSMVIKSDSNGYVIFYVYSKTPSKNIKVKAALLDSSENVFDSVSKGLLFNPWVLDAEGSVVFRNGNIKHEQPVSKGLPDSWIGQIHTQFGIPSMDAPADGSSANGFNWTITGQNAKISSTGNVVITSMPAMPASYVITATPKINEGDEPTKATRIYRFTIKSWWVLGTKNGMGLNSERQQACQSLGLNQTRKDRSIFNLRDNWGGDVISKSFSGYKYGIRGGGGGDYFDVFTGKTILVGRKAAMGVCNSIP